MKLLLFFLTLFMGATHASQYMTIPSPRSVASSPASLASETTLQFDSKAEDLLVAYIVQELVEHAHSKSAADLATLKTAYPALWARECKVIRAFAQSLSLKQVQTFNESVAELSGPIDVWSQERICGWFATLYGQDIMEKLEPLAKQEKSVRAPELVRCCGTLQTDSNCCCLINRRNCCRIMSCVLSIAVAGTTACVLALKL